MVNKSTIFLVAAIFLLIAAHSPASAKEIMVDDNGSGADFQSIQEAVNSSSPGDVVLVSPGSYNESVDIEIQNISIFSDSEDPEDTTVRAFNISANNTIISGFSIEEVLALQGSGAYYNYPVENCTVKNNTLKSGIDINECYNSTIERNVILNSGISLNSFDEANFTISDNLIFNGGIDIYQGPDNCTLLNNTLLNGSIRLTECDNHKILGNYISNSLRCSGIGLWESYSNEIENNTVVNCSNGISMEFLSSQNIINNNTLTTCSDKGIWIKGSGGGGNSLLNNTISNNNIGIWMGGDSSNNLVANNKVELNKKYGVYLNEVSYELPHNRTNQFQNNIFNNTVNLFNDTSSHYTTEAINNGAGIFTVSWNTTKTSGTNILGGPYLGGNLWAKPDGTGFSQICADSDGNGIGDLPYNITDNDTDYFPLVSSSRSKETIIPVANFSTNITHTLVPLAVKFTDFSKNATAVVWDFSNDGIPDSTASTPVYAYTYPGNYTINLTVNNTKGMDSKSSTVTASPAQRLEGKLILTEFQITANESDEIKPAIYGDKIVWQGNHNGTYTVHLYDIYTSSETPIVSSNNSELYPEFFPTIYDDRVVWRESGKINLYNLSTSTKTLISNELGIYPVIYGDKIVWQGECNGDCIYMYDISSSKQVRITNNKSASNQPAIYENRIVWESRPTANGSSKIFMYDLSTENETQIITDESYQQFPAIYGDRIVWEDYRNGNKDIYMYDLSTAKEIHITTSGLAFDPAIYGDRIVWQDNRNDKEYIENSDIYMYDLSTSKETQITTCGSASSPTIYGNKIVWEDRRNGNTDIYMCIISEQEEKQTVAGLPISPTS
ncbi:NosD domain-containing protein [Methanosarcina sp. Z-7115]|uniref:NosD domain-containing protein n=1 Tax=Methanosarcina baikalica TaxID=3073890 RepID=A0ABU2D5J8_9EURY|nr:NosD domain-containing protein [Methanosarcina sp. Z-7115]MDR7667107.1 NosD domain-containing protein [Methanosarcina sp. Z-7115]